MDSRVNRPSLASSPPGFGVPLWIQSGICYITIEFITSYIMFLPPFAPPIELVWMHFTGVITPANFNRTHSVLGNGTRMQSFVVVHNFYLKVLLREPMTIPTTKNCTQNGTGSGSSEAQNGSDAAYQRSLQHILNCTRRPRQSRPHAID